MAPVKVAQVLRHHCMLLDLYWGPWFGPQVILNMLGVPTRTSDPT